MLEHLYLRDLAIGHGHTDNHLTIVHVGTTDILILTALKVVLITSSGSEAIINIQHLNRLPGHISRNASAARHPQRMAALGHISSLHPLGNRLRAVHGVSDGGDHLFLRLIKGEGGGTIPSGQLLYHSILILSGNKQADNAIGTSHRTTKGAHIIAGMAAVIHLGGDLVIGVAILLRQCAQNSIKHSAGAATQGIEPFVDPILNSRSVQLVPDKGECRCLNGALGSGRLRVLGGTSPKQANRGKANHSGSTSL